MELKLISEIETPRLQMTGPTSYDDLRKYYRSFVQDEETYRHLSACNNRTENEFVEHAARWLREWSEEYYFDEDAAGHYNWLIYTKSGEMIGAAAISASSKTGFAHIGIVIGRKYWHKGYATEVIRALIRFAFDSLDVEVLTGRNSCLNPYSGRAMRSAGMHYEGLGRAGTHYQDGSLAADQCWSIVNPKYAGSYVEKHPPLP